MQIQLNEKTISVIISLLAESHIDTHEKFLGESSDNSRSSRVALSELHKSMLKQMMNTAIHYVSQAYIEHACLGGLIPGNAGLTQKVPGIPYLEWKYKSETYKFCRTSNKNVPPPFTQHRKDSCKVNASQLFLELGDVESYDNIHWSIVHGINNFNPSLNSENEFYVWMAPFSNKTMISDRVVLFEGLLSESTQSSTATDISVTVDKPKLSRSIKDTIFEELNQKISDG